MQSIEKFKVTTCRIGGGSSNDPKEWGSEIKGFRKPGDTVDLDKKPGI